MHVKVYSVKVSDENAECVVETGGEAVHVIKRPRTWLNFVLMFYGT